MSSLNAQNAFSWCAAGMPFTMISGIEIEHFNVEAHDVFVQHLLCDVKIADEPPKDP